MPLRPQRDKLLVKRLDPEAVSKGGIIIPESAKERPMQALVVAVAPRRMRENGIVPPPDCAVDDTIIIAKYHGTEVEFEGQKLLVVNHDDILGVVETND